MAGAPINNDNAHRGHEFKQAIKRALTRLSAEQGDDRPSFRAGLDRVAQKYIQSANAGELAAIRDMADRLDGKPAQSIDVSGELNIPLSGTVKFVKSSDK